MRSEDPQDQATFSVAEARTAAGRGQPRDALRPARAAPGLLAPLLPAERDLVRARLAAADGAPDAAALAVEEARDIAERLRCQARLDRAKVSAATAAG